MLVFASPTFIFPAPPLCISTPEKEICTLAWDTADSIFEVVILIVEGELISSMVLVVCLNSTADSFDKI
jgi:hypothetical protein